MDKRDFLEHERLELQTRLMQSLDGNDIGTYKNLIQAYERILMLQSQESNKPKEEWALMYSDYKTNGDNSEDEKLIRIVAVWEQKGDEIRNHRMFEVKREVEYNDTYGSKGEVGSNPIMAEFDKRKFRTVYKFL